MDYKAITVYIWVYKQGNVVYLVSIRLQRGTTGGGSTTVRRIPTLAHPTIERSCVAFIYDERQNQHDRQGNLRIT